jgi:hypothetical protein
MLKGGWKARIGQAGLEEDFLFQFLHPHCPSHLRHSWGMTQMMSMGHLQRQSFLHGDDVFLLPGMV